MVHKVCRTLLSEEIRPLADSTHHRYEDYMQSRSILPRGTRHVQTSYLTPLGSWLSLRCAFSQPGKGAGGRHRYPAVVSQLPPRVAFFEPVPIPGPWHALISKVQACYVWRRKQASRIDFRRKTKGIVGARRGRAGYGEKLHLWSSDCAYAKRLFFGVVWGYRSDIGWASTRSRRYHRLHSRIRYLALTIPHWRVHVFEDPRGRCLFLAIVNKYSRIRIKPSPNSHLV